MKRKLSYVYFLPLFCCACMVGPDYQRPPAVKDNVLQNQTAAANMQKVSPLWYENWQDSQLNRLIALGLQNNTDIKTAISRIKQARAELYMNAVQYLPTVSLKGGYNYQKSSRNIGYAENAQYYSAGFDAAWELDLWGKGRRQIQSDEAKQKSLEYNLKNVQAVVAAEIALQYVNLYAAKEQLHLTQENVKLQQQILQNVQAQLNSGLTDELSYQQADYLLQNSISKIPALKNEIEQYSNALSVLIGVYPADLPLNTAYNSPLLQRAQTISLEKLEKLPADIIRQRPDVAAAEQNLIGQNAQIGVAVASLYPAVNIAALWGFAAKNGHQLFGSDSHTHTYTPLLELPFLDWYKLQNNVRLQKYLREEYLEQYKATLLQAVAELRNAIMQVKQNTIAVKNLHQAMSASQKMLTAVLDKYNNGLTDFSDVLTTQQNYIAAQSAYVLGKAGVLQSVIAYYKAAGGGYS